MTHNLQVKEHLRNKYLYESGEKTTLSGEWKHKLFKQFALQQQLKNALNETPSSFGAFYLPGAVFICFVLAISAILGFISPEHWFDNVGQLVIFDVPSLGLKEVLIFVIALNGLTFIIRKRSFFM